MDSTYTPQDLRDRHPANWGRSEYRQGWDAAEHEPTGPFGRDVITTELCMKGALTAANELLAKDTLSNRQYAQAYRFLGQAAYYLWLIS